MIATDERGEAQGTYVDDDPLPYDKVVAALGRLGMDYRASEKRWGCPVHDGGHHLAVDDKGDRVLVYCHNDGETSAVVAALGLTMADLSDAQDPGEPQPGAEPEWARKAYGARDYAYFDEAGTVLYRVRRTPTPDGGKKITQHHPDGTPGLPKGVRLVLSNLPRVLKAVAAGETVHVAEGEKAVHALSWEGHVATCNSGGSGSWRDELADSLKGAREVVVWRDLDDAGTKWVAAVMASLRKRAIPCRVVESRVREDTADAWDHLAAGYTVDQAIQVDAVELVPGRLPEGFWAARPELAHIRQAAHARACPADAVLYGVLARLSSQLPGDLCVDTGILSAASLNLFAAIVADSGVGKSSSAGLARLLLPTPEALGDAYQDELPIGSGEGLAEAYMGLRTETTEDSKGKPRETKKRAQVRHNALFFVDEGHSLVTQMERQGATLGQTLRTAWVGGTIGQTNGSEDRTRRAGDYAMGLVIGFQPSTAMPLLAEDAAKLGTPQRFVWAQADDPSIPDDPPADPGPLWSDGRLGELLGMSPWGNTWGEPFLLGDKRLSAVTVEPSIKARLRAGHLARQRGEVEDADGLNSHRPLTLVKLAALLALLGQRCHVTEDDWQLAVTMWGTSCAVRDSLVRRSEREKTRAREDSTQQAVERQVRIYAATVGADHVAERTARLIHGSVRKRFDKGDDPLKHGKLKNGLKSDKRTGYEAAFEYAESRGWLALDDEGYVVLGDSAPA